MSIVYFELRAKNKGIFTFKRRDSGRPRCGTKSTPEQPSSRWFSSDFLAIIHALDKHRSKHFVIHEGRKCSPGRLMLAAPVSGQHRAREFITLIKYTEKRNTVIRLVCACARARACVSVTTILICVAGFTLHTCDQVLGLIVFNAKKKKNHPRSRYGRFLSLQSSIKLKANPGTSWMWGQLCTPSSSCALSKSSSTTTIASCTSTMLWYSPT